MTESDLISKVRFAIDESDSTTINDNLSGLIKEKAVDALALLIQISPKEMFGYGDDKSLHIVYQACTVDGKTLEINATVTQLPNKLYKVTISKPSDYVRMSSIYFPEWIGPLYDYKSVTDAHYGIENSTIAGVGSTQTKPSCYISDNEIQAYSIKKEKSNVTGEFRYYAKQYWRTVDGVNTLSIPVLLENAVIYMTASLIEDALGEADMAAKFLLTAKSFINRE